MLSGTAPKISIIIQGTHWVARLFLIFIVFMSTDVFSHEDASLEYSSDEAEPAVVHAVKVYPPLAPDALERIYNLKKEAHRIAIATKKDMPFCLQAEEGPLPFYGTCTDAQLVSLKTDHFASLQFDNPEVQEETKAMRLQAIKIKEKNIEESLKLLYISGWKMGDPESVSLLIKLLIELRYREEGHVPEYSNLISVLSSYPKTVGELIRRIYGCRSAIDYRNRKDKDFEESDDDSLESEDDLPPMLGIHERYGLRRRYKSEDHK
jgi:hypothetical protein